MFEKVARFWCRVSHRSIMYGGGQHYQCRECLRRYPAPWGSAAPVAVARQPERQLETAASGFAASVPDGGLGMSGHFI